LSRHNSVGIVLSGESLVHSDSAVGLSIHSDVSSANNDSAVSLNANSVSNRQLLQRRQVDDGVSNRYWSEGWDSNSDWVEGLEVGSVVLSCGNNVSNNDNSVGNSSGLRVRVRWCEDVSSNSSVSSDGSSRSKNVVDDSLDDSGEWLSSDLDISSSSDINNPSCVELASNKVEPVALIPDGGINRHVVEVVASTAGDLESISVDDGGLSVGWESGELGLDVSVVGKSIIISSEDGSVRLVVQQTVSQVRRSSEGSSNVGKSSRSSSGWVSLSIRVQRSRRP